MQTIERGGYTRQEVIDVLHGKYGSRVVKFRYDLLDENDNKKGELERVLSGEVSMSAFSTIKRTATFTLEEEIVDRHNYFNWSDFGDWTWSNIEGSYITQWSETYTYEKDAAYKVNWLLDKIQPFVLFKMPDGNWIEFSLGVFYPSTPTRKDNIKGIVREVEAYDGLVVLDQDKFTNRWTILAGTPYKDAIINILQSAGISKYNLEFTGNENLPNDKEFSVGTSKLEAINELLSATNNVPLWVDSSGYYVTYPYRSPSERGAGYTYDTDKMSVIIDGIEEELDLFGVPNSWVVTVENPELPQMVSVMENNSLTSPTSIPNRKRKVVDFREVDDISSQAALDAYTERIAFESSQVYGRVYFKTPIMPIHEYYDVIHLRYPKLKIDDIFAESKWTIKLEAGALMEHEARKVVNIG